MVLHLLGSLLLPDKIYFWGNPHPPIWHFVHFCKLTVLFLRGDWGFPQSVKSQKSVCGVALQIGFFAFYFRKWGTTCYACQYESSPLSEVWQKTTFYQIFRKEVSPWRIKNENVQLNLN